MTTYKRLVLNIFLFHVSTLLLCSSAGRQLQGVLSDGCICSAKTDYCKCCRTITISFVDEETAAREYNDTVCVKIKNLRSKPGIRFSFSWNGKVLIQHKLKTLSFPPFCVATPRIHTTDVCLKFNNLIITSNKTTGCVVFEVDSVNKTNILSCGCFSLVRREKITRGRKNSLLSLLESRKIKKVALVNKNKQSWEEFVRKNLGNKSSSEIAQWMNGVRSWNGSMNRPLLGHVLPVVGDKVSLSTVDCWCYNTFLVRCECCAPVFGERDTRYRGCVHVRHFPHNKALSVSFMLNGKLKMKENIPSKISQKLCNHHKITKGLKIGVCIKPSRRRKQPNRQGLCLDIDARKSKFHFKHHLGCVFLATVDKLEE